MNLPPRSCVPGIHVALWLLPLPIMLACTGEAPAQDSVRTAEHHFVASARGTVYYPLECDAWHDLARANLRYFRTASDAERGGYRRTTARSCAPPASATRIVPTIGGSAQCTVQRVADGDTFECTTGDRVRLLLIDAPELAQGVVGDSARRALATLAPPGSTVRLEFDVQLRDQYDRLLAYVFRDSLFVNRAMLRAGMAVTLVIPPNVRHVDDFRRAVDSARSERRGLWSTNAFQCTPEDFRAGRCG